LPRAPRGSQASRIVARGREEAARPCRAQTGLRSSARELLNRLRLVRRCLEMPGLTDEERAARSAKRVRAEAELRELVAAGVDLSRLAERGATATTADGRDAEGQRT
jgi:hypothetical protein